MADQSASDRLDGQRPDGDPSAAALHRLTRQLLESVPLPKDGARRLTELLGQLTRPEVSDEDVGAAFDAVGAVIADAITGAAQPRSLLGRVFAKPSTAGPGLQLPKEALGRILALLSEDDRFRIEWELVRRRLTEARTEEALLRAADELAGIFESAIQGGRTEVTAGSDNPLLRDALLRLLDRVPVPVRLSPQLERIKAVLQHSLRRDQIDPTLEAIANLILRLRSAAEDDHRMQQFLQQLSHDLDAVNAGLSRTAALREAAGADSRDLDHTLRTEVRGIEDSFGGEDDVERLKRSVRGRLAGMIERLERFRSAEEERARSAEAEAGQLADHVKRLEAEADQLRSRLAEEHRQAFIDPLTGIPNRLAYDERIAQEEARWRRYGSPLVLMIGDVDHFKAINDTYGHQAGDRVLKALSSILTEQVRDSDFVARYGGEEFVLLLPESDMEGAARVGEKLRRKVGEASFHYHEKRVPVTISFGFAAFREGDSPEDVFARADRALYHAKQEGRDRCCGAK